MFRRRQQLPDLTNECYARWLRAQRPPMPMFLGLSELEQEALASIGDEYTGECLAAIASVLRGNPSSAPVADEAQAAAGLLDIAGTLARAAHQHRTPQAPSPGQASNGFGGKGGSADVHHDDGAAARAGLQAAALSQTFGVRQQGGAE